jgi:hypothetical protein
MLSTWDTGSNGQYIENRERRQLKAQESRQLFDGLPVPQVGSLIRALKSLFCVENSLFAPKKFPVPLCREFRCKLLNSLAD